MYITTFVYTYICIVMFNIWILLHECCRSTVINTCQRVVACSCVFLYFYGTPFFLLLFLLVVVISWMLIVVNFKHNCGYVVMNLIFATWYTYICIHIFIFWITYSQNDREKHMTIVEFCCKFCTFVIFIKCWIWITWTDDLLLPIFSLLWFFRVQF